MNRNAVKWLASAWLVGYSGIVYAFAAATFAQEMETFDFRSLGWAVVVGLASGIGRTVLGLANENFVVVRFWRQLAADIIIASFGGAIAWGIVTYLASVWPSVFTKELRFICIVLAGASRGRWQEWVADLFKAGFRRLLNAAGGSRPGPQQDSSPTTVTLPLTDK